MRSRKAWENNVQAGIIQPQSQGTAEDWKKLEETAQGSPLEYSQEAWPGWHIDGERLVSRLWKIKFHFKPLS